MEDPRDIELLIEILVNPIGNISEWIVAARAVAESGDVRAVEPLIEILADPDKREPVAWILGELGDARAVEPLMAAYTAALSGGDPEKAAAPGWADSYGTARDRIIFALGRIGDRRATETLIAALDDPGSYIESSAYRGLGMLGDPLAVEPLLKRLLEGHDSDAAQALLEIGNSQAMEGLYQILTSPDYLKRLRCNVAEAFKRQGQPMPDLLFDKLDTAETLEECCDIVAILGISGEPRAFQVLLTMLNNPKEILWVKRAVISALYECDPDRAVEPLLEVLTGDSSRILRALAAQALKGIGWPEVTAALCEALNDEAACVRASAACSLERHKNLLVIPALKAMFARESMSSDDLKDYEHDRKYFLDSYTYRYASMSPEECARESIRSNRAYYGWDENES